MKEQPIEQYLKELSSAEGLPGGGSAAALISSLSAALSKMVVDIYSKRKQSTVHHLKLEQLQEDIQSLIEQTAEMMDKDATAFDRVAEAYKLPKKTEVEKAKRKQEIERGLEQASHPPLEMMEAAVEGIELLKTITSFEITGSIVNDIAVAVLFAKTSLEAASLNVLVNTRMMKQLEKRKQIEEKAEHLKQKGMLEADALYESVLSYLEHGTWPGVATDKGGQR